MRVCSVFAISENISCQGRFLFSDAPHIKLYKLENKSTILTPECVCLNFYKGFPLAYVDKMRCRIVLMQNYGPWFDIDGAGIHSVVLADMKNVKGNLSSTEWTYQVQPIVIQIHIAIGYIVNFVVDYQFPVNAGPVQKIG